MDDETRRRIAFSLGLLPAPGEPDPAFRRRVRELLSTRAPTIANIEAIVRQIPGVDRVTISEGVGEAVVLVVASSDNPELLAGVRDKAKRDLDGMLPVSVRVDVVVRPPGERGDALESAFRLGGLDAAAAMMREGDEDDEGVR